MIEDCYAGDRVKVKDTDGTEYTGTVICVSGADEIDADEDELDVEIDKEKRVISFKESEIESITLIE